MTPTEGDASPDDLTRLLQEASRGNKSAFDRMLPLVYEQLRAVARQRMYSERPGHTLQATALVHEAFLRLVGPREIPWESQGYVWSSSLTETTSIDVWVAEE